jgi:hypothetical protein
MPDSQGLFDALAGAGGANVNRPQLNAYIANSQAINGLRSAQTEDALMKAQELSEQSNARGQLEDAMGKLFGPNEGSKAHAATMMMLSGFGDAKTAIAALNEAQQNQFHATLGDSSQLGSPAQTAAMQGIQGKLAPLENVPNNFAVAPGAPQPDVYQSPQGAAQTALTANQAANPQLFHPGGGGNVMGNLTPQEQQALSTAISEGRQDPTRVNSRNAKLIAQTELNNPGTNFNRLHADASLQSNATFQQRAMSVDMLPGLLQNMTTLGKKLNGGSGYNDLRSVGTMQQWLNGQTNDPDYTEYMTVRNDALLRLASVMRGVGMSDQAHTAEIEASAPTLAPYALDAWMKGQMSVVQPLLDRQNKITHLGEKGQGTAPLGSASAAPAAPTPAPLGSTVPTGQGQPAAAAPGGLPPGLTLVN